MITHPLNELATRLCLVFLVVLPALPSVSAASSKLTFAFSEASSSYSSSSDERAAGLFPDLVQLTFSFADLSSLTVIVERGSKWEDDDIPDYLARVPGQHLNTMMHLLMLRGAGDFMVQPAEDARFAAQQLGYSNKLKIRKVDFIPNSQIPFHIGVSRKQPFAMEVIDQVDAVMQSPEFQSQQNTLIENYR